MTAQSRSVEHAHRADRHRTGEMIEPATVLFARHDIVITHRWFYSEGHRYAIAELRELARESEGRHGGVAAGVTIGLAALGLSIAAIAAGRPWYLLLITTPVVLAALALAGFYSRRWPPRHILRARYRGAEIVLMASRDPRTFGQACRAVQRAHELVPRVP